MLTLFCTRFWDVHSFYILYTCWGGGVLPPGAVLPQVTLLLVANIPVKCKYKYSWHAHEALSTKVLCAKRRSWDVVG